MLVCPQGAANGVVAVSVPRGLPSRFDDNACMIILSKGRILAITLLHGGGDEKNGGEGDERGGVNFRIKVLEGEKIN